MAGLDKLIWTLEQYGLPEGDCRKDLEEDVDYACTVASSAICGLQEKVKQLKKEIKIKHGIIDALNKRLRDIGAQC